MDEPDPRFLEVLRELHDAAERGEAPSEEELLARHPGQEELVRRVLAEFGRYRQAAEGLKALPVPAGAPTEELDIPADDSQVTSDSPPAGLPPGSLEPIFRRLQSHAPRQPRYRPIGEVGAGGMGVVYRVWDEDLRRNLAMKVALGQGGQIDPRTLARFLEEAQVTGQLDHPGIVPVHELGLDAQGRLFFTMKLVKGKTLKQVLDELGKGDWTQTRVLGLILKVCEAMAYAHDKGVIHRDLKPSNIMVGRYGEVYVMDWGLAKILGREDERDLRIRPPVSTSETQVRSERHDLLEDTPDSPICTMDGDVVGSPAYMPPEQAMGHVAELGPPSDVYAVGTMLYHLLAGHMPYVPPGARASNYMVLRWVQEGPPKPLSEVAPRAPAELVAICEKAMARAPDRRYADMAALAGDLSAYLEGHVVRAYETGAWAEARKWVRRNAGLSLGLAAGAVSLVLAFAIIAFNRVLANRALQSQVSVAESQTYRANVLAADLRLTYGDLPSAAHWLQACSPELRGWEWHHMYARLDPSLLQLAGPTGGVRGVAFDRSGANLATAWRDGTVRVCPTGGGEPISEVVLPEEVSVMALDYGPDGLRLACRRSTSEIEVWDGTAGNLLVTLTGHSYRIADLDFDASGDQLASASADGSIRVWDLDSGRSLAVLSADEETQSAVCFAPDGSTLTSGDVRGALSEWDITQPTLLRKWRERGDPIRCLDYSPDGRWVASVGHNGLLQVWDLERSTPECVLTADLEAPARAAFSPAGTHLGATSDDGSLFLWEVPSWQRVATWGDPSGGTTVLALDPTGTRLAAGSRDDQVRLWAVPPASAAQFLQLDAEGPNRWTCVAIDRSPGRLGIAVREGVLLLDSGTAQFELWIDAQDDTINALRFCDRGEVLLTGSDDGTVRSWSAITGQRLSSHRLKGLPDEPNGIIALSASDGGRIFAAVAESGPPQAWDAEGAWTAELTTPETTISIELTRDGSRLFTGLIDGSILEWETRTGALLRSFDHHKRAVMDLALAEDADLLVSASMDGDIAVWSLEAGNLVRILGSGDIFSSGAFFAEDGQFSVALDEDRSRLFAGSGNGTLRVWDLRHGLLLANLEGHSGTPLSSIAWDPRNLRILTFAFLGELGIWHADMSTLYPFLDHLQNELALPR